MKTQQEFDAAERAWRSQLAGRSLVIEANADVEEALAALKILGSNFANYPDERRRRSLLKDYRAAFLVGTCAAAAVTYDAGRFWPHFDEAFGCTDQDGRKLISEQFREALEVFGLSRFTFPRKNVDEMLMHAGIPGQRVDEVLALLEQRNKLSEDLDGRQFCQWVAGMSRGKAYSYGLDAPTWRFLAEGREIVEDLVDRCLDLLDLWSKRPISVDDLAAFPSVMQKDILRSLDEMGQPQQTSRSRSRHLFSLTPQLTFDASSGVQVRLPALEHITEERIEWTIAAEGRSTRLVVDAPWPGDPVKPTHYAVNLPVKQVAMTAHPGQQSWLTSIVDPDDPMLCFDATTSLWIPPRNTLPQGDVWLAVPNPDGKILSELLEVSGSSLTATEVDAPLGWSSWLFAQASLSLITKIRTVGAERWRYVSTITRPSIDVHSANSFVTSLEGIPVSTELPVVMIPPVVDREGSEAVINWLLTINRAGDNIEVHRETVQSNSTAVVVSLESAAAKIKLGTFDFKITGPLGRGTTQRVSLARGLKVTSSADFRPMNVHGSGLIETTLSVELPEAGYRHDITLSARQTSVAHELHHGDDRLTVVLAVPAMSVSNTALEGQPTSHAPIHIDLEALPTTSLRISTGIAGPTQLAAMRGTELLQSVTATANLRGVATFTIAQLTDTLAGTGGATLLIGFGETRVPVAYIRPRRLLSGIERAHSGVSFMGLVSSERLEIACYARYAPWLGPTVLRTDGSDYLDLPDELCDEGELRMVVTVDDPWVQQAWPFDYPSRTDNTFDVVVGELKDDPETADSGFRTWLRREGPCVVTESQLPLAISLYAGTALSKYRTPAVELHDELAAAISAVRTHVFSAFSVAASERAPIDLFVNSDIVTIAPGDRAHTAQLWESSPLLAVLAHDWSSIPDGFLDDLLRVVGEPARSILADGTDPYSTLGRFTSNEELLARMPDDRINEIWRVVSPVPGRVLEDQSRQIAAKQMFDNRLQASTNLVRMQSTVAAVRAMLTTTYGPAAAAPIDARMTKPGWTDLPAFTLAFAFVARAAARDNAAALFVHEITKPFLVSLARLAPKLVEQDLILAELWLTRWSSHVVS